MNDFKLEKQPKITSGFTAPDGYFDSFSEKVLAQLPKQESKVISIFSSRKTWYFTAAAVLMLLLSVPIYIKYASNSEEIDTATLEIILRIIHHYSRRNC